VRRRRLDWWIVAFLLLAVVLRFPGLGVRSLWFDEAFSGSVARLSTVQVLTGASRDNHPPGHFLLLHLCRPLGASEFALRFPSAWCSVAAVALVARLGCDLFGKRAARLAALGMAIAPFQVYYAQEARMYGLVIALSAGSLWAFLRAVRGDGRAWWLYGLFTALGLYTHYYAALAMLALHLWLLLDWQRVRRVLLPLSITDGLLILAFLPQGMQFLARTGDYLGGATSWQSSPTLLSPLTTGYYLLFGHALPLQWVWVGLFIVLALGALAFSALVRCGRKSIVWMLPFVAIVPLLLILAVSLLAPHSIYSERTFAVVTPALMLFLAWAASVAPRRSPAPYLGTALVALMIVGTTLYHFRPDPAKPSVREASALVAQEARATDTVLHLQDASYLPVFYYTPDTAGVLLDVGQRLWMAPDIYTLFGARVAQPEDLDLDGRVWLTVMPGYVGPAQAEFLARWDASHALSDTWDWEGVQVRLYDAGETR
jgi:mannosyltransferase